MQTLNPYLNFRGEARGAMDFYQGVFGGEVTRSTFAEFGMPIEGDEGDWIMHSQLETPAGFTLMVSDAPSHMELAPIGGMTISLSGDDEAALTGYWNALADGGSVSMPLERAPWGDSFGQLVDRFGVPWMLNISGSAAG